MKVKLPDGSEVEVDTPEGWLSPEQVEQIRREALQKARTEEREKLHSQIDQSDARFKEMQGEVKRLADAEQARAKEADDRAKEAEKARKAKDDAELSAKELVARQREEFNQQLEQARQDAAQQINKIRQDQETQQAFWEREREMSALQLYIRDQVEAHREEIAPELLQFIDGDSKEAVDASIQRVVTTTAQIVDGMRQAQSAARRAMPGVAPSGGQSAITAGIDTGDQPLTADDIRKMPMKDFAALRDRTGMSGAGQGVGIFG